jgi:segregation and condensation protein B
MAELTHTVEALLFVASEPLSVRELAALTEAAPARVERALDALGDRYGENRSGVVLERVAGGYGFRASASTAAACARLVNRAQNRPLSHAATETLAVVAYLGPVSRPEIARIRGVASDSAAAALVERGLVEEAGRSQFGAVLYRTTPLFCKQFGLNSPDDLPDVSQWDPSPDEETALRDRLLQAGAARSGAPAPDAGMN